MRKASHLLTILLVGMYHFVDGATTADEVHLFRTSTRL